MSFISAFKYKIKPHKDDDGNGFLFDAPFCKWSNDLISFFFLSFIIHVQHTISIYFVILLRIHSKCQRDDSYWMECILLNFIRKKMVLSLFCLHSYFLNASIQFGTHFYFSFTSSHLAFFITTNTSLFHFKASFREYSGKKFLWFQSNLCCVESLSQWFNVGAFASYNGAKGSEMKWTKLLFFFSIFYRVFSLLLIGWVQRFRKLNGKKSEQRLRARNEFSQPGKREREKSLCINYPDWRSRNGQKEHWSHYSTQSLPMLNNKPLHK